MSDAAYAPEAVVPAAFPRHGAPGGAKQPKVQPPPRKLTQVAQELHSLEEKLMCLSMPAGLTTWTRSRREWNSASDRVLGALICVILLPPAHQQIAPFGVSGSRIDDESARDQQ